MQCYSENTAAKFTTKLPNAIDLSCDSEAALSEIVYPTEMDYSKEDGYTIKVCTKDGVVLENTWRKKKNEVPEVLIRYLNTTEIADYYHIAYDKVTKKATVRVSANTQLTFNKMLSDALGFTQTSFGGTNAIPTYVGERINIEPNTMYVYCDVIEHVVVGDTRAPLLKAFGREKSANDVTHRTFPNPVYVPLQKKHFEDVEINIMTDTGEPMPFAYGKSIVILHFRRSSNYFLLQR